MILLYPGQGCSSGSSLSYLPLLISHSCTLGTLTMLDLELDNVDSALLQAISQESQHPVTLPLQAQSWALPT